MSTQAFPTPYAGTYYPIYNSGLNQYIPPTPDMPFDRVSAIFAAFAHAYRTGTGPGAELQLEQGQPDEPARLQLLCSVARQVNPKIKILVSLGWGQGDWTYISDDYTSGTNNFPASVVALIRAYELDGFDIDDESVDGTSGFITQPDFNAVIQNIRNALDAASQADGKPYYLTIAPAGETAQVTRDNVGNFDLINVQCYGGSSPDLFIALKCPARQVAWGINTEECSPAYPEPSEYQGLAGIFNWTMSSDSACSFRYTRQIAADVGYSPAV